jgi:hypothetical protein
METATKRTTMAATAIGFHAVGMDGVPAASGGFSATGSISGAGQHS